MQAIKSIFTILAILVLFCQPALIAQTISDDIIFKAMNDELNRSITKLTIGKYPAPFFISYQFNDGQSLMIQATLGALKSSNETPVRTQGIRLMVGDYSLNNENFNPAGFFAGSGSLPLPLVNDYAAIRRAFWIATDQSYKRAINSYEQKLSALKQQNKSDEVKPDDYSKTKPVTLIMKSTQVKYDKPRWETFARDVSGVFKSYAAISNSSVFLALANATVYLTNNEGTKLKNSAQYRLFMGKCQYTGRGWRTTK
jgi:hypothetical protein